MARLGLGGCLGVVAAAALAASAHAEAAPPFAALLAAAQKSPNLAVSAAEVDAATARLRQARTWRNPEVSLEAENFGGERPYRGFDAAESTLSVSQTLELGGKRQARTAAAGFAVEQARAEQRQAGVDFAARLALAYGEAEAADARVTQLQEAVSAAEADARVARLLVENGREAQLRGLQAAAEAQAARASLSEAVAAREAAFARLTAVAGTGETYDALSESLLTRSPAASSAAADVDTPAVLASLAARNAAASRVDVERRQATPDVTVSAGVRRYGDDDATAFIAGVSAPLPLFDRNRGATDAARAELRAADARLQQARLEAAADLAAARAQSRSATSRVEAAQASEAAAAEAYRLARIGYEAGRLPLLELSAARRALAAARTATIDARLARLRAEAEIARLTGRTPFGA
ncbi:MAG: TolC family protein [Phenylobacterium sp.]|uniref:TolC family protein n=1 Tax=Phenylobacterium sp. TaxID=1871053 RepID=UPI001A2DFBA5|nr:TolC family protein [Phenylobacterium sp.]MBJ7412476.1 TolC family protein [Phenylobacterium sp.]